MQKCKSAYGLCKGANVRDIPGAQVSALWSQVLVIRYGYGNNQVLNPYPNLGTRTRLPTAETRDLKISAPANHPVSGFPLSVVSLPRVGMR